VVALSQSGQISVGELALEPDRSADVPIGVQLVWGLRSLILSRALEPGRRLPGLRELSQAVAVNSNTVRAVYQRLEHEGLVETRHGSGTFVSAPGPAKQAVMEVAESAARAAGDTGLDLREVAAALYSMHATEDSDSERARRRELRQQIASFEQTLIELQVKYPQLSAPLPATVAQAAPRLLTIRELEEQRSEVLRRLTDAQAAIDGLGPDAPAKTRRAGKAATATGPATKRGPKPAPGTTKRPVRRKPAAAPSAKKPRSTPGRGRVAPAGT